MASGHVSLQQSPGVSEVPAEMPCISVPLLLLLGRDATAPSCAQVPGEGSQGPSWRSQARPAQVMLYSTWTRGCLA